MATDDSATTAERGRIGIAMVGYAFMGLAHSQGWRNARSFFDPALVPELVASCGRNAEAAGDLARRFGWESVETDWRAAIARDDVDIVDICTPGDTHAEIAIAALAAGKHVLCEKPLANSVAEAGTMADAAEQAGAHGVASMVGFTYRRVPAIALASSSSQEGRIGEVRHVRAQYLQDWLVDPRVAAHLAACRRSGPARVRSATSVPTSSTSRSSSPATGWPGSAGSPRPSSRSARCRSPRRAVGRGRARGPAR